MAERGAAYVRSTAAAPALCVCAQRSEHIARLRRRIERQRNSRSQSPYRRQAIGRHTKKDNRE